MEDLRVEYGKLLDRDEPLESRMKEMYRLKESPYMHHPLGAQLLLAAIDTTDSVLLQHELAYNVGQTGQAEVSVPGLEAIVRNSSFDPVTRHEAAEALGALGSSAARQVLLDHSDPAKESAVAVRETCELALARIMLREKKGEKALTTPAGVPFVSVDPSPAFNPEALEVLEGQLSRLPTTVDELETLLLDQSGKTTLFVRYMAMFSLRNIANDAAARVLMRALREDKTSCLLRHEVAFVLGQLERGFTQSALVEALKDEEEAPMVRHEAAIALGGIADPASVEVLKAYAVHSEPIVRESCIVALEMLKYWVQFNEHGAASLQKQEVHA